MDDGGILTDIFPTVWSGRQEHMDDGGVSMDVARLLDETERGLQTRGLPADRGVHQPHTLQTCELCDWLASVGLRLCRHAMPCNAMQRHAM